MHSINALELPEITKIIVDYLSNFEPCLTVCKAWRSLYLPYYWREVQAGVHIPVSDDHTPFFDPIRHGRYRKFIRVLMVYNDFSSIHQSLDYPNLRMLRLHCPRDIVWSRLHNENPVLKDFVNRHPLLECLDLHNISPSITDLAWTALVDHPRLEKMNVRRDRPVPDDFWRVCARLTTLEFSGSAQWCIPKDLVLSSIRRLWLMTLYEQGFMHQLDITAACPLLEELVWETGYDYENSMWTLLGHLATQSSWPHLQRLSIDTDVEDAVLSQVIASMHQATKIEIHSRSFGPLCFAALQRHASTLQYLRIPDATGSRMIVDVLCTFARLEHLETGRIEAKDIAEDGSWACTSLKKLSVMISFSDEEDDLQPVVFERISRLMQLEEFNSWSFYCTGNWRAHGLIFRLQSGMAALASLSRLRHVGFHSEAQAMGVDDARWIMDHWKRLEIIQGRLHQDKFMEEQLGVLISTSEIEIQPN